MVPGHDQASAARRVQVQGEAFPWGENRKLTLQLLTGESNPPRLDIHQRQVSSRTVAGYVCVCVHTSYFLKTETILFYCF